MIRNFMISKYLELGPQAEELFHNLLHQVAIDYGNSLRQIFGEAVTEDYIQLLHMQFELIDAFLSAQKEGNVDEINRITQLLYQNAEDRSAFIGSLNPFWDQTVWEKQAFNNVNCTINEFTTFLMGDYARNIDIFSTLLNQAEVTGDYFVRGVLKYLENQCRESLAGR